MRRFVVKRVDNPCNSTERLNSISSKNVTYIVDRLHIKGHTESWCLENCHPILFPEIDKINTVVCEQANFRLGNYRYIMKYMNFHQCWSVLYVK